MNTFDAGALEAKARAYIDRALEESRDSAQFAFWCHLALEPLARAALAHVSPVLLADGRGSSAAASQAAATGAKTSEPVRSASLTHILDLCARVLPGFTGEFATAARRLAERRNAELHTGDAAFEQLALSDWYADFIRVVRALAETFDRTLDDLLGDEEAALAEAELVEEDRAIIAAVRQAVGRATARAGEWTKSERASRMAAARTAMSSLGPHDRSITCPACTANAVLRGEVALRGVTRLHPDSSELYEPLLVVPTTFRCPACELHLDGRGELRTAGLGDPFTVASEVDPVEFHGIDVAEAAEQAGLYVVDGSDYGYEDE
jgi:hypothetical protein